MRYLLSIKTVIPRPGGRVWYDNQLEAHGQIYDGDDGIDYAFMGSDPNAADNQWLRAAYENQVGVIYFPGIAPGRYQPIWPVYIADRDAKALKARSTARCAERIAAFQDSSRRLRCLPHRHRSRLSRRRFGMAFSITRADESFRPKNARVIYCTGLFTCVISSSTSLDLQLDVPFFPAWANTYGDNNSNSFFEPGCCYGKVGRAYGTNSR